MTSNPAQKITLAYIRDDISDSILKNYYKKFKQLSVSKKIATSGVLSVLLVAIIYFVAIPFLSKFYAKMNYQTKQEEEKLTKKSPMSTVNQPVPNTLGIDTDTKKPKLQDWSNFSTEQWPELNTRFNINADSVWTIKNPESEIDVVTRHNTPNKGGIKFTIEFEPVRGEDAINLYVMFGSNFKWEVGSGDTRSLKLIKGTERCGSGALISPKVVFGKYLMGKDWKGNLATDEIIAGLPSILTVYVFQNDSVIQTNAKLDYYSKRQKKIVSTNIKDFEYQFPIGDKCSQVSDLSKTATGIGVGLATIDKSVVLDNLEKTIKTSPRVKITNYQISEFSIDDYNKIVH